MIPYEQVTVSDLEMTVLDGLARLDLCAGTGQVATGLWIRQDDFDWNRLTFYGMTLPETLPVLKQGVGRLIRTETDWGVIAILDSRINTKRYGQQIVASLPRARRTRRIADVRRFFAEETTTNVG
ncbi:MAG: helicase C-terminal domain-containing protein [Chloroflexota bacterium]|nr:helicase C-terminal domain-containing protein [Chloroflexota bacterium]